MLRRLGLAIAAALVASVIAVGFLYEEFDQEPTWPDGSHGGGVMQPPRDLEPLWPTAAEGAGTRYALNVACDLAFGLPKRVVLFNELAYPDRRDDAYRLWPSHEEMGARGHGGKATWGRTGDGGVWLDWGTSFAGTRITLYPTEGGTLVGEATGYTDIVDSLGRFFDTPTCAAKLRPVN